MGEPTHQARSVESIGLDHPRDRAWKNPSKTGRPIVEFAQVSENAKLPIDATEPSGAVGKSTPATEAAARVRLWEAILLACVGGTSATGLSTSGLLGLEISSVGSATRLSDAWD
jgi:hypothetical protein